ncbi:MAG TPA: O-antigen ligase family protein [Terriglobales bacterium]|jgi:exopolysaccharide production protein ExoQ|nr:O-antigen ligase family protein [Terriglobales bacterium]
MTEVATLVFLVGILGLFWLDRDSRAHTSRALWLPVFWLLIIGSRPVSVWLQGQRTVLANGFEDGSPLDRSVFLVLIILALAVLFQRRAAIGRVMRGAWPVVLFFAYCAVSIVWSDYPDVAAKRWFKSLGDLAMILIIATDPDRLNALKRFLARVGFILLPWSILLIKYYGDLGRAYSKWEGTAFYVGVASDKNMLGMTCMIFGLGAAWRFINELRGAGRRKILIVHGTIYGMAWWLISTANSMTSLSCFGMGTALMLATSFPRMARRQARVHLMVAAILLLSSSVLFLNIGGGVLSAMGRNPTLTGRTDLWHQLFLIDRSPLVGAGFESFWSPERVDVLEKALLWAPNEAHDGYLEVYLNLGWVGVFLLGLIIVVGYRAVLRCLRRDPETGPLRLSYFVVGLAYSFTEAGFRNLTPIWIAFLLAVIGIPSPRTAGTTSKPSVPERTASNSALALAGQEVIAG